MSGTLQGAVYEVARRHPHARALGFYSPQGALTWWTYDELLHRGLGAGGWLRAQGLRRGDTCLLAVGGSRRIAPLLLGVLCLGAVPLTMAPPGIQRSARGQAGVIAAIARRARARLIVTDDPLDGPVDARVMPLVRDVSHDLDAPAGAPVDPVLPSSSAVASYQLTSGTTGLPRICIWEQRAVVARLATTRAAMGLGPEDLFVSWTPLHHTMGLLNSFLLCLTSGIPLVLVNPHDFVMTPALWLRALSDTRATQTWSANFGFALAVERITDDQVQGVRLDSMRGFWNAAERIHVETLRAFHARFAPLGLAFRALKTNYGCAENVGGATFGDPAGELVVERVRPAVLYEQGVAEPVAEASGEPCLTIASVGRPCEGLRVEILRRGRRLPDGHVGEVALVTTARMKGYVRDASATRVILRGRRLMTGDLGYVRGRELFWTGRARERITVRGRKIDPSDFDPVLHDIAGVERGAFVAFGVDDAARGTQKVVVVVEVRDRDVDVAGLARAIRAAAQRDLGVALEDVVLVPKGSLARTTSGKRRHRAHRERYLEGSLEALRIRASPPRGSRE